MTNTIATNSKTISCFLFAGLLPVLGAFATGCASDTTGLEDDQVGEASQGLTGFNLTQEYTAGVAEILRQAIVRFDLSVRDLSPVASDAIRAGLTGGERPPNERMGLIYDLTSRTLAGDTQGNWYDDFWKALAAVLETDGSRSSRVLQAVVPELANAGTRVRLQNGLTGAQNELQYAGLNEIRNLVKQLRNGSNGDLEAELRIATVYDLLRRIGNNDQGQLEVGRPRAVAAD